MNDTKIKQRHKVYTKLDQKDLIQQEKPIVYKTNYNH